MIRKTLLLAALLLGACEPYVDLGTLTQPSSGGAAPGTPVTLADAGTSSDGGSCPDPNDPRVHYIGNSNADMKICLVIFFSCEASQRAFSDLCGCGCIDP